MFNIKPSMHIPAKIGFNIHGLSAAKRRLNYEPL